MRAPLDRGQLRIMERDIDKMLAKEDQSQGMSEEIINKIKAYQGEVMYLNAKLEVGRLNLRNFIMPPPRPERENKKEELYQMKFSFDKDGTLKKLDERERISQAVKKAIDGDKIQSFSMRH